MKKSKIFIISFLALILIIPISVLAFDVETGNSVYIAKGEEVNGNMYAAGQAITIDGDVNGDVICAGQSININGNVEGDVICAGQSININGNVNGNIRVAGNAINIKANVARNLMAFGSSVALDKDASVGWDMLVGGAIIEARGKIQGNLYGGAGQAIIAGEIQNDVDLKMGGSKTKSNLIVQDTAVINGNLNYTDYNDADISANAAIAGETNHYLPKTKPGDARDWGMMLWGWGLIYKIFASLVLGLVLISLWKKQIIEITDKMLKGLWGSIGRGVVLMFITPILAFILMFTLIGIPLALILIALWLIAMCVAKILVGILVGRSILEKSFKKKKANLLWSMVLGIIVTKIIVSIPILGWLIGLIIVWWGLGGLWLYFKKS